MAYRAVTVERSGHIAEIILEDAPLDAGTLSALDDAAAAIHGDSSVHVAVLTGGPLACGDAAIAPVGARLPFRSLELMGQPVIAAIEHACDGAGLELALACDVRIASDAATFGMPAVAAGRVSALGGTQRLPRIAGRTAAAAMLLLGDTLSAEDALRRGLVNAVTPAGAARAAAMRLAEAIASRGPVAVRYAKETMLRGAGMTLDAALGYETDLTVILQTTADRAEGVAAFIEKRAPRFEGR